MKTKFGMVLLALCLSVAAPSAASAANISGNGSPPRVLSNTTQVFTLSGGALRVSCTGVTVSGAGVSSPVGSYTATVGFTGCTTNIGGTRAATVAPCPWTFRVLSLNTATGATTDSIGVTNCIVIRPTGLTCSVVVDNQTVSTGVTNQNNPAPPATPTGVTITGTNAPVTYTSNCPGVVSPGTGTYTGSVTLANIWAVP